MDKPEPDYSNYDYCDKSIRLTQMSKSPRKFHKPPIPEHFTLELDENINKGLPQYYVGKVETLYKLNVRNNSSCNDSLNTVYYKGRNSGIIKSVILK
jgi:hypothetical protein